MARTHSAHGSGGFTLIELMVAVAIASILLVIAIPAYRQYVLQSHRTEAKNALLDLAGREERYYDSNVSSGYTANSSLLGYGAAGFPMAIGSGYYQVNVCVPGAAAPCNDPVAGAQYMIIATPIGTQVADTTCALYSVDSTGQQLASNAGGINTTSSCW